MHALMARSGTPSWQCKIREVVQSGLKFEIGRPAAHPGVAESAGRLGRVAESAGRPAGSSG